jgi:eukaryotic-like serine/threonine-protein kinase
MPLDPGVRLGPYEIVAPLGAGGMGEVYRARDTNLARDVALKLLPETLALDADRIAMREAQVLASLNHPNIAAIYGFEDWNGRRALVLELVEGLTIAERLQKAVRIGLEEALAIARQIVEALEAAHEKGIHRDLKPANIALTADGQVKVLDFGLARLEPGGEAESAGPGGLTQSPTLALAATQAGVS